MEKIQKIAKIKQNHPSKKYNTCEGYVVETTEKEIFLLIDSNQLCCEEWGYFLTEDDPQEYIGATLHKLELSDTCRKSHRLPENPEGEDDGYFATLFVDLHTDRGVLQFVAYNGHNGYYGHEARVYATTKLFNKDL